MRTGFTVTSSTPSDWPRPSSFCNAEGLADPGVDPTVGSQVIMAMVTRFAEAWFIQGMVDCSFEEGVGQLNLLCLNALGMSRMEPDE